MPPIDIRRPSPKRGSPTLPRVPSTLRLALLLPPALVLGFAFPPSAAFAGPAGASPGDGIADRIAAREFRSARASLDSLLSAEPAGTPERGRFLLQRAICQKGLGLNAEALSGLEAAHAAFAEIEDYLLFWEAECLEALERPDAASERYGVLVRRIPASPLRDDARLRMARIAEKSDRPEEAGRLYAAVSETAADPDDAARARFGLAASQLALGRRGNAEETFRALIRTHPGNPWALRALGRMGDPRTAGDRYDRAQVYFHHGQWAEAASAFRDLVAKHPKDSRAGSAHYWMARSRFAAREYEAAVAGFTTAYRRYRIPAALFYLGRCAVRADDDRKGAERLLDFATRYPADEHADEALWYAAWSLERTGDYGGARKAYLRLASGYPKSRNIEQSRFRACFVLYSAGRYTEAARAFAALGDSSKGYLRDQSYFWVGKCRERLSDPREARDWYGRSARSFPASYYAARAALTLPPEEREALARKAFRAGGSETRAAGTEPLPPLPAGKADLLAGLGLFREAGREFASLERRRDGDMPFLRSLLGRYERIRSYGRAMRLAGRLMELEGNSGGLPGPEVIRRLYPTYYLDLIRQPAAENRVEPALVLAIIRQESAFDPGVVSGAGARGLMQIMPATGTAWAAEMGIRNFTPQDLDDPAISVRYGCREIASYLPRFPSDLRGLALSLSSYNAGLNVAQKWSASLPSDVDEFIENVPYHETRNYIKQVVRNYEVYKLLLAEGSGP